MRFPRRGFLALSTAAWLGSLLHVPAAHAHILQGEGASFLVGLGHPVSGLDHVLAMIAVGLWGAQLGLPALWILPVTFPMVMALGGMLGLLGVPLPGVEVGIALSAILLGLAVMSELRPPLAATAVLVGIFAIFHGYAVYNDKNEKIGVVDDLIITPDRSVSYAIIGAGGFLGIGKHDVAIPVGQFKEDKGRIILAGATKDALKAMPKFEYAK
jgi:hydrogenase/urease accessory protein HupE